MKKVFVSCPMNGASKEEVMKRIHILHKLAELHFHQELQLIDSWIDKEPEFDCKNPRLWYAGKSLEHMSQADCYVGVNINTPSLRNQYFGCHMENEAADLLQIPHILFDINVIVPTKSFNLEKEGK